MSKESKVLKLADDGGSVPTTKNPDQRVIPAGKPAKTKLRGGSKPTDQKEERRVPPGSLPAAASKSTD